MLAALMVGGLFVLSGGALVWALTLSRRARLEIDERVNLVASALPGGRKAELWRKARSSEFDQQVQRLFAAGRERTWGMASSGLGILAWAAGTAAAIFIILFVLLGTSIFVALPVSLVLGFLIPRVLLLRQQNAAERAFTDLFPDSVVAMARMLRAGLPVSTAVRSVSTDAPAPVDTIFATIANQVEIGTPIEDALDVSSRQIGLADFRFFAVAVVLQHTTGGNLAVTLEILADIVRRRRAVRLKARATTAEIRVSAYVLGSLPFLIVGSLLLIQPTYLSPLFTDPRGHIILGIAVAGFVLAGLTMRQMMRSVTSI